MIILLRLTKDNTILLENLLETLIAKIKGIKGKEIEKSQLELLKSLKSVSTYERILLMTNDEIRNVPFNKFLLSLDSVILRLHENYPYIRTALKNPYIWSISAGMLILYSGLAPIYFRNLKVFPGPSVISRPINIVLITQSVTITTYLALVGLLNISGSTSISELMDQLIEKTRENDTIRIVQFLQTLNIPKNTLLYDHLTKNKKLFAPISDYYFNPNFIADFTMENAPEFPMPIENIASSIGDDLQIHPAYQYFGSEIKILSLPILAQLVLLFGPLPRPLKTATHFLVLSNRGLKGLKGFLRMRENKKIEQTRESLIKQFS